MLRGLCCCHDISATASRYYARSRRPGLGSRTAGAATYSSVELKSHVLTELTYVEREESKNCVADRSSSPIARRLADYTAPPAQPTWPRSRCSRPVGLLGSISAAHGRGAQYVNF